MTDEPIILYPQRVHPMGMKFEGGEESGEKIVRWLWAYGVKSTWIFYEDKLGRPLNGASGVVVAQGQPYFEVWPGEIVILQPNGTVVKLTPEQFKATYHSGNSGFTFTL